MSYQQSMEKPVQNEVRAQVGEYFVLCLVGWRMQGGYTLASKKRWRHGFEAQAYAGTIAKDRRPVIVQVVGTIVDDTNLVHMGVLGAQGYWCGGRKGSGQPYLNKGWSNVECDGCLDRKDKGPIVPVVD